MKILLIIAITILAAATGKTISIPFTNLEGVGSADQHLNEEIEKYNEGGKVNVTDKQISDSSKSLEDNVSNGRNLNGKNEGHDGNRNTHKLSDDSSDSFEDLDSTRLRDLNKKREKYAKHGVFDSLDSSDGIDFSGTFEPNSFEDGVSFDSAEAILDIYPTRRQDLYQKREKYGKHGVYYFSDSSEDVDFSGSFDSNSSEEDERYAHFESSKNRKFFDSGRNLYGYDKYDRRNRYSHYPYYNRKGARKGIYD